MNAPTDRAQTFPNDEGMPDLDPPAPGKIETGDPQDGLPPPGDRPRASVDFGTSAEEQRHGEPLDLRIAREVPDAAAPPAADRGLRPTRAWAAARRRRRCTSSRSDLDLTPRPGPPSRTVRFRRIAGRE